MLDADLYFGGGKPIAGRQRLIAGGAVSRGNVPGRGWEEGRVDTLLDDTWKVPYGTRGLC